MSQREINVFAGDLLTLLTVNSLSTKVKKQKTKKHSKIKTNQPNKSQTTFLPLKPFLFLLLL